MSRCLTCCTPGVSKSFCRVRLAEVVRRGGVAIPLPRMLGGRV